MITRIEALRFRSLRHVAQNLSGFQLLVGPNGSGKSAFLDVVSFLGDLLDVGPRRAILGEWSEGIGPRALDPAHLCWMREGNRFELAVELQIPEDRAAKLPNGKYKRARYEVAIETGGADSEVRLDGETLWLAPARTETEDRPRQIGLFPEPAAPPATIMHEPNKRALPGWKKVVYKVGESGNDYFNSETSGWNSPFRLGPTKPALANLPEDEERFPVATWAKRVLLEGIQRVQLDAQEMREPSPPGEPRTFLPDGTNLPWVIESLATSSPDRYRQWIEHVRTALPDLRAVETVERPEDRHRYLVIEYENGLKAPSWLVSDGTLRLLALTLIAYLPNKGDVYLIEEPENGIHPRAVETVFESLSSVYEAQVFCASHSPVVLSRAKLEDVLCFAKNAEGATDIVRGDEHPRLREWKGALDLGTLFAAGVLDAG